jgi:nitrogen regulatory protein PII
MENCSEIQEIDLVYIIVNFQLGSKILKIAKQHGITGGTIFLGKGTVKNPLLEWLDIYDIRKEIVLLVAEKTVAQRFLIDLNKEFNFDKPHHGIAFSTSVINFKGCQASAPIKASRGEKGRMYNAIFTIVDKGKADDVIDAAKKAGSRGGTIINARGSGIHESQKIFSMDIEPEKEIVLVLVEESLTDPVVSSIREHLRIDEPGNGIIFVQNVNETYGLS